MTVITWSKMLGVALKGAALLAEKGIDVEVVDLRTLAPLDKEAIVASVLKTGTTRGPSRSYQDGRFCGRGVRGGCGGSIFEP